MRPLLIAAALALFAAPATAQVEVATLAAPDYFSLGDRSSGIGSDFWLNTSPELARDVIGTVGRKPLSPAFAALGRLAIGAGVPGPEGVGRDPEVAAARTQALLRLGAPQTAWAAVERAPGVGGNLALAEAAADAALVAGQDDFACKVSDQLTVGRGEIYWLRLRAYCQARAGQSDAAQLTFTLAGEKARDAVYARLMGALLAGAGDPGAASLRNGLDLALSRRLALDLEAARATASPAVAAALWPAEAVPETEAVTVARSLIASGRQGTGLIDTLLADAEGAAAKARPALIGKILILEAMGAQTSPAARARLLRADAGKSGASPALLAALDRASVRGYKGEVALVALLIAGEAGAAGPTPPDRARVILALRLVGLGEAAEPIALEGLAAP